MDNIKLSHKYGKFLNTYFEVISIVYHLFSISFLGYLIFIRTDEIIPEWFIHLLGLYVVCYGLIILIFGPRIINKINIY